MSVGADLFTLLQADSAVVALVGSRVYPLKSPALGKVARVVYTVVSDVPEDCLDSSAPGRTSHANVQVDCYSPSYAGAHALADAVDAAIGNLSAPTLASWSGASQDLYDNEAELYRVLLQIDVWH